MPTTKELIQARIGDPASVPGNRLDDWKLALVGCGGAMAGVVSAAFAARLEQHGMMRIFDLCVSVSAGSIVNAYFLAGQAIAGSCVIPTHLSSRGFDNDGQSRRYVDWRRTCTGGAVWDISMYLNGIMRNRCVLRFDELMSSNIPYYSVASSEDGTPVVVHVNSNYDDLISAIEDTCRIPLIIDKDVAAIKLWDGQLSVRTPLEQARQLGATHFLVMRNEPATSTSRNLSLRALALIVGRKNKRLSLTLEKSAYLSDEGEYARFGDAILDVRPRTCIGRFETNQGKLWEALFSAHWDIGEQLGLPPIDFPRSWKLEQLPSPA